MQFEIQKNILKYILQKEGVGKYVQYVKPGLFDAVFHQSILIALKAYYTAYSAIPSKHAILDLLADQVEDKKSLSLIEASLDDLLQPIDTDYEYTEARFVEHVKSEAVTKYVIKYSTPDSDDIDEMAKDLSFIQSIGVPQISQRRDSKEDWALKPHSIDDVTPTFIESFNELIGHGGWYAPQLVKYLAPSKSFKTGLGLCFGQGFTELNKNVLYIDTENGTDELLLRHKQLLFKATAEEILSGKYDDKLELYSKETNTGRIIFDVVERGPNCIKQVCNIMDELKAKGIHIHVVIIDYMSNLAKTPLDVAKRVGIEQVDLDVIDMNNKYGIFTISPSQVKHESDKKHKFDRGDFPDDNAQSNRLHAGYGFCRTPDEKLAGVARLEIIVQRVGLSGDDLYTPAYLKINPACMDIKEITYGEYMELMNQVGALKADNDAGAPEVALTHNSNFKL
jgi:hypothetical protein